MGWSFTEMGGQSQGTFVAVVVLLFAIAGLSAAPLSASKEGWLHFYQEDMETTYLRNLNLEPWDHFISVGYYKVLVFFSWHKVHSKADIIRHLEWKWLLWMSVVSGNYFWP